MIFVTTGDRIAVENFTTGLIYKVTFSDTSIAYMMCVGIGSNFVMLQGPNPSLFCLTMESASQVSTIDVHDPTPPEPPTPIENALQYQTGEPPFTFTTTESSLFSWYIEGPCGVKTANLFNKATAISGKIIDDADGQMKNGSSTANASDYIDISGLATVYISASSSPWGAFYDSSKVFISGISSYGTKTVPSGAKYMRLTINSSAIDTFMVADTQKDFEPYGYKISILSNDNAETIYLDEALAEGERLYSVNIDTVVVTDIGENTFSVNPTPPEMQIVYGIYAEA